MTVVEDWLATAVKWVLSLLGGVALWLVRGWAKRTDEIEGRLRVIERDAITRQELNRHIERLEAKLDRVLDRLVERP